MTADTVSISFDKAGKYLFTDFPLLKDDFGASLFKGTELDFSSAVTHFILDTEKMDVLFNIDFDANVMFVKMNIESFIPNSANPLDDDIELISEATSKTMTVAGKDYPTYFLYPISEPEDTLTLAIDTTRLVDNNKLIDQFLTLMLKETQSNGTISYNLPNGLILAVYSKQGIMIEAISVEDIDTTITISHSFKIKE